MKNHIILCCVFIMLAGAFYGYQHYTIQPETESAPELYYKASPQGFNGMTNVPVDIISQWKAHDVQLKAQGEAFSKLKNITEIGPFNVGGRVRSLLIDQSDPCRYFAGSVSGGLWVSNDCGQSWQAVDDQGSSLSVSSIIQDPDDPQVIYYGTGEGYNQFVGDGVYISTDGGVSFENLLQNSQLQTHFIWGLSHAKEAKTFFVGTDDGIFKVKNDASGLTYKKVFSSNDAIEDIEVLTEFYIVAGSRGGEVFRSIDKGETFQPVTSNLPPATRGRVKLAYPRLYPSEVYAVITQADTSFAGLYHSDNFGASFSKVSDLDDEAFTSVRQLEYDLELAVHPEDPQKLLIGYVPLRYSLDGGNTWARANPDGHPDQHVIVFPNQGEVQDHFIYGNDGGVFKKYWNNLAGEPVNLNRGFRVTQFYGGYYYPEGANYLALGGTQDNGTRRIHLNFNEDEPLGGDGAYAAISQRDPNIVFFTTNEGILASTRGNASDMKSSISKERNVNDTHLFTPPVVMDPTNDNTLYYLSFGRLWRTTDRGKNWKAITNLHKTGVTGYDIAIAGNGAIVYTILADTLYKLSIHENMVPGEEVMIPTPPKTDTLKIMSKVRIDPHNPNNLYLISESEIYLGEGINSSNPVWNRISDGLPNNLPVYDIAIDPEIPQHIFAGTYYGLYAYNQGNWYKEESIPFVQCRHLEIRPTDRKLFVFTHGRGIWTSDITDHIVASLPYSTSFEEGIDAVWTARNYDTNGKLIWSAGNGGLLGERRIVINRNNGSLPSKTAHRLKLNLSEHDGDQDLLIRFLYTSRNNHPGTSLRYVTSEEDNAPSYELHDLRVTTEPNQDAISTAVPVTINFSKIAEKYGIPFNQHFMLQFQHQADGGNQAQQEISYDMIQVGKFSPQYVKAPYAEDFEGGQGQEWLNYSPPGNKPYAVTDQYAAPDEPGNRALVMEGKGYKDARLFLDISDGRKNLLLHFSVFKKNLTQDPGAHAGVYLRNPVIPTSERKIYEIAPGSGEGCQDIVINLEEIIKNNLSQFSDDYLEIIFRGSNHEQAAIAIDNVNIRENYEVAQLPYFTGFESGSLNNSLDPYWTVRFEPGGNVEIVTGGDAWGQKALALYGAGTVAKQQAHLHLNLQQATSSEVKFECNLFGYGNSLKKARVLLYDATNPAVEPVEVRNLQHTSLDNAFIQVNLKQEAAKHQIALSADFVVVIETESDQPIPTSGILIDNVKVYPAGAAVPADLPYVTDFSENVSKHWKLTTNTGRSEVITWSDARFGSKVLALHGNIYGCNYSAPESTNDADLHLNLAGMSGVRLQFHYRNYQNDGPLAGIQSGVWISDNGGYSLQKIYDFPAQNQLRDWERVEINLDSAVQSRKLKYTEDFVIVFRAFSRYKMEYHYSCRDGIAIDRVVVYESEDVQTEEKYIAHEAHDGHEYDFKFRTIEDVRFSSNSASNSIGGASSMMKNYRTGLIWTIDIPKNATILKASIQLTSSKTHTEPSFTYSMIDIYAQQSSNATDFVALPYIYNSRMMTKHNVPWLLHANWVKDQRGQKQRTPDLTVLAQTLVNMSYWTPGNKMCFIIKPQYPEQPVQFDAYAYRSYADNAIDMEDLPALHIEYITKDGKVGSATARVNREEDISIPKNISLPETFDFTEASDAIMLYPNPVTDRLTVQFPNPAAEDVVTLLDMQGSVVKQIDIEPGQTQWEIPMEDLPSGIYLLGFNSREKVYRIIKK